MIYISNWSLTVMASSCSWFVRLSIKTKFYSYHVNMSPLVPCNKGHNKIHHIVKIKSHCSFYHNSPVIQLLSSGIFNADFMKIGFGNKSWRRRLWIDASSKLDLIDEHVLMQPFSHCLLHQLPSGDASFYRTSNPIPRLLEASLLALNIVLSTNLWKHLNDTNVDDDSLICTWNLQSMWSFLINNCPQVRLWYESHQLRKKHTIKLE
jgi:hypothetical protein